MKSIEESESEVKQFIIDTLHLEDVSVDGIESGAALFGDGRGLDSVDALELGVALKKKYGITVDPRAESTRVHFASVKNLAALVRSSAVAAQG